MKIKTEYILNVIIAYVFIALAILTAIFIFPIRDNSDMLIFLTLKDTVLLFLVISLLILILAKQKIIIYYQKLTYLKK